MATNEKYTMRAFLENVKAGNVTEVEQKYAEAELVKLDARNEARKGKESKTAKENAPIKEAIVTFLESNPGKTAAEVGAGVGQTTAKASALLTQLVKDGQVTATEVKALSGKGKVKAYTLA